MGGFHYFERIGIGHLSHLRYDAEEHGLNLTHNTVVFFNYHLKNTLGEQSLFKLENCLQNVLLVNGIEVVIICRLYMSF